MKYLINKHQIVLTERQDLTIRQIVSESHEDRMHRLDLDNLFKYDKRINKVTANPEILVEPMIGNRSDLLGVIVTLLEEPDDHNIGLVYFPHHGIVKRVWHNFDVVTWNMLRTDLLRLIHQDYMNATQRKGRGK